MVEQRVQTPTRDRGPRWASRTWITAWRDKRQKPTFLRYISTLLSADALYMNTETREVGGPESVKKHGTGGFLDTELYGLGSCVLWGGGSWSSVTYAPYAGSRPPGAPARGAVRRY